jgi:hypothetical protein
MHGNSVAIVSAGAIMSIVKCIHTARLMDLAGWTARLNHNPESDMNMMVRRMALTTKKPDFMPVVCRLTRIKKGKYLAELWFALSRREFTDEIIECRTKREAKRKVRIIHPNIVSFRQ